MKNSQLKLLAEEEQIEAAYRKQAGEDFLCFARGLIIDSGSGPQLFENCMAPFQRECFEELAPSLTTLRNGGMPEHRNWWWERTKKASKDADLAVAILWLLAYPTRPIYIQVAAANREQAAIVKDRMSRLLHWNPWLNEYVEIIQWEGRSRKTLASGDPMAKLHIMSSSISGAHGGTPDILIINELSHVTKWEYVENLMDNASGVQQGMVVIATNAGFQGSKAETWRKNAMKNVGNDWVMHCLAKPAPWHTKATIDEARRRNSHSRFLRLWEGRWVSSRGDALAEEDIEACLSKHKRPLRGPQEGWSYVAGLDLGVSHDHCGLAVVGVNPILQRLRLAYWKAWEPAGATGEVDLIAVEDACYIAQRQFRLTRLFYDPHQAKLMAQRLTRRGVYCTEMSFSVPSNLTRMATTLVQMVSSRKLECYDDEDGRLRRDFGKFNIVERSYGYKLEATSDENGHADVGTALAICLPAALDMMGGSMAFGPEDDLVDENDGDLNEKEVKKLPVELRDIYEMSEEPARVSMYDD